ncbi:MAG TPA: hypothetical protein VIJ25_19635, partial [Methylococcales bacterium]
ETDVRSIRDNLSMLLTDVAVIKSNYASKTDIADLKTDISKEMLTQTRWIIATLIALISLSVAIQRFLPPQSSPMPIQAQSIPNQVEVNTNQPINKPAPTTNNIKQPTAHPSTTP